MRDYARDIATIALNTRKLVSASVWTPANFLVKRFHVKIGELPAAADPASWRCEPRFLLYRVMNNPPGNWEDCSENRGIRDDC